MRKLGLFLLTITFIPNAHAYVDPGTGSFLLQMFVASLLGAGLTIKLYFKNLKEKIRSFFSPQTNPSTEMISEAKNDDNAQI